MLVFLLPLDRRHGKSYTLLMKVLKQQSVCQVDRLCTTFSDRASFVILERLREKSPRRFSELLHAVAPVSTRTLTVKLKTLAACGVISQERFAERPPRVEYRLTQSGKAFTKVLIAMSTWSSKYLKPAGLPRAADPSILSKRIRS